MKVVGIPKGRAINHLDRESAQRLLSGVLSTYQSLHGKKLTEVFLHCRSTINEEEFEGYLAACPEGRKIGRRTCRAGTARLAPL